MAACAALLGWSAPARAQASRHVVPQFVVVDYHAISKTRVAESPDHRPLYDYIYRVDVRNSGARAVQVIGQVASKRRSVAVIDGNVVFGTIDHHEIKTSQDTFTVRAGKFFDRRLDRKIQVNDRWRFEEEGSDPEDDSVAGLLQRSSQWRPDLLDFIYNLKFALIFDWKIQSQPDATAPTISNTLPAGLVRDAQPMISASYADPGGTIATAQVVLTVDGVDVTAQATVGASSIAYRPSAALSEGPHSVALRAPDNAGNVANASWAFTVDTQSPSITLPSPIDTTSASPGMAISASYSDATSGIDLPSVGVIVDGQDVTALASITVLGMTYQPPVPLANGEHAVQLTLADAAGNAATLQWRFGVDASGPDIENLQPANGAELAADVIPTVSAVFADGGSGVDVARVRLTLDGVDVTAQAQITQQGLSYTPSGALSEGNHQVAVSAHDVNGNETTAVWSFVTRSAPEIFDAQPNDMVLNAGSTVVISAHYRDVGSGIDPASVRLTIDGVDFTSDAQVSATAITLTPAVALPQGLHVVSLSVSDRAGNVAASQWRFMIDTGLPHVVEQRPRNTLVATATPTITADYEDTGTSSTASGIDHARTRLFVNGTDVTAQAQVDSGVMPHRISYTPAAALPQGNQTIRLVVADRAGNEIEAIWTFTIDIEGPAITDLAPADGTVLAADALVSLSGTFVDAGSGIDTASARVELDGEDITAQSQVTVNGFTRSYTQPLSEGSHTLRVRVRDVAGNETSRESVFRTSSAPVIGGQSPRNEFLPGGSRPVITARISDVGSGVDFTSLRLYVDAADVTVSAQISGDTVSYAVPQALADGTHTVRVVVTDRAGGSTDTEWQFGTVTSAEITVMSPRDVVLPSGSRPTITASFSNRGLVIAPDGVRIFLNDQDVTAQATIGPGSVAYTPAAPLAAGSYTALVEIVSQTNTVVSGTWGFAIEEEPRYELSVIEPADAATVGERRLTVIAAAVANKSFPLQLTLNDIEMSQAGVLDDGRASYRGTIGLTEGSNSLVVRATFDDGTTRTVTRQVTLEAPLRVTITAPADKSMLGRINPNSPGDLTGNVERPVTITGRISRSVTSVLINQQSAQLLADGSEFRFDNFFLREGANMITAVAKDASGRVGSAAITVSVDQTAPILTVESPAAAAVTSNNKIDVRGMVNDAVEGLLGAPEPTVTVNGRAAQVFDRYYLASDVPLQLGGNEIKIEATDQFGNSRSSTLHVSRIAVGSDRLTMLSGNHQQTAAVTELPQALTVAALDASGQPLANLPVRFDVERGTGSISTVQGQLTPGNGVTPARNLVVNTDASGQARVWLTVGKQSGPAGNVVKASHPQLAEEVVFVATTQRGAVAKVSADTGINQFAETGSQPLELLSVVVRDRDDNVLPNVPVVFKVVEGDAYFGDINGGQARSIVLNTDKNGLTALRPTLGTTPGLVRITARALREVGGDVNDPADLTGNATYLIQVKQARDGPASFKGFLYTDKGEPLPGVRVSIGRTALSATSDEAGAFELIDVPPGRIDLFVDGRTSNHQQKTWPSLHFESYVVRGHENLLPHPIYLPPLLMSEAKIVGGDQDVVLKIPGLDGFQMKVKANSVTFPDGSRTGTLVVSPVTADRLPMAPPAGGALFGVPAWTIQPAGTRFDPPLEVQLPNSTSQPAGDNLPVVQWDHDLGQFVPMGRATVTEDGAYLITDAGSGVTKAGWGGLCVYDPTKCGQDGPPSCGLCQELDTSGECPSCRDLEPCRASGNTTTGSAEFPKWQPFKERLETLMEAIPVISDAKFDLQGKGTKKDGEECCTASVLDRCRPAVQYTEVNGTGELKATIGFGPAAFNVEFKRTLWWGSDRWRTELKTEVSAIKVDVTGTAQAQVKTSGCESGNCVSYSGAGSLKFILGQLGLEGEIVLEAVEGRPSWDKWRTVMGAGFDGSAKLNAGGIRYEVKYADGPGCSNPGLETGATFEEISVEAKIKLYAEIPGIITPKGGFEWSWKEVLLAEGEV